MKDAKKAALLLIGKPKPMDDDEEEEKDESYKEDAGKQLMEAFDSGNGEAVYKAVADIVKLIKE